MINACAILINSCRFSALGVLICLGLLGLFFGGLEGTFFSSDRLSFNCAEVDQFELVRVPLTRRYLVGSPTKATYSVPPGKLHVLVTVSEIIIRCT